MKLLALCESRFVRKIITFGGILSHQAFEKRLASSEFYQMLVQTSKRGLLAQNFNKCYRRAWRKAIKTKQLKDWEAQKLVLSYFKKAVTSAKRDSWHSFVESMNSQTPTARLVKIIRRNETVRVSNVIKHNGEFTKSPPETFNYLLDILSPGRQQTENQATGYNLVNNPFIRPEDTEMIANICSFERIEAAINEFQPFKAPGPDGLYPVLLQKGWNQLKGYYHVIFQA